MNFTEKWKIKLSEKRKLSTFRFPELNNCGFQQESILSIFSGITV